jgi:SAM-dependent methyltransferase
VAPSQDPYSRIDYRRLIAWPSRIEREGPLLLEVLESGPSRRVLDLGCGTGEHSRLLAAHGFEVVGVDASESMLEKAREAPVPENLCFVQGRVQEIDRVTEGDFGGAVCLGNALPHLTDEDFAAMAAGLRRRLLPGAPFLLQILNYDRIFGRGERTLPVNFRPGDSEEDGEVVFLRLMQPQDDGTVLFFPSTLRLRPGHEPPLELITTREVKLRGWRREEVEAVLEAAGFHRREALGSFTKEPFDPLESRDLLLIAR